MYKVMKRDGTIAEFDIAKISKAITKAFEAEKCEFHPTVIDLLALKVTSDFSPKIKDGIINVEDIQDSVERVLSQAGYTDVAKAYILYRKQREKVRNVKATMLNYKDLVDSYLDIQRLAREGKLHRHLFGGRPDPEQQRRDYRQLLAQRNLR